MFPETLDIPEARFLKIINSCLLKELEAQITSKTFRIKEKEQAKRNIGEDDIEKTIDLLVAVVKGLDKKTVNSFTAL